MPCVTVGVAYRTEEVQTRCQNRIENTLIILVTDAFNPMNVARVILALVFCTFFTASHFTNKVNGL